MARSHRHLIAVFAICCSLGLPAASATAQDQIAVIVARQSPGMTTLDTTTLRGIYLKKIFLDGQGQSLIPVNLPAGNPLRRAFSRALIHMSDTQLRTYWNRRYFQGISPPYVLGSQNAVVRFVAQTPGAIGYVLPCFVDESVRQVMLLPATGGTGAAEQCPTTG